VDARDQELTSAAVLERQRMSWPPSAWEQSDGGLDWPEACQRVQALPAPPAWDWGRAAREAVQTLVLSAVLLVGFRTAIGNFVVQSYSMEPTLYEGQRIWVTRLEALWSKAPARGDIVVFQSWGQDEPFVKRVVGLPGETVQVRDGRVFVDGEALDEPYLHQVTAGAYGPVQLGPDQVFVMGDNRGNSADSRTFGPLPVADIVGTARVRYWPPGQVSLLGGARPVLAGPAQGG
jgi:signal peptidase I